MRKGYMRITLIEVTRSFFGSDRTYCEIALCGSCAVLIPSVRLGHIARFAAPLLEHLRRSAVPLPGILQGLPCSQKHAKICSDSIVARAMNTILDTQAGKRLGLASWLPYPVPTPL
jgi:hypothetical protein